MKKARIAVIKNSCQEWNNSRNSFTGPESIGQVFCGNCLVELHLSAPPEPWLCVAEKKNQQILDTCGKNLLSLIATAMILRNTRNGRITSVSGDIVVTGYNCSSNYNSVSLSSLFLIIGCSFNYTINCNIHFPSQKLNKSHEVHSNKGNPRDRN